MSNHFSFIILAFIKFTVANLISFQIPSDIPACAHDCFIASLGQSPCIYDGALDLACTCTSYNLYVSGGGRMTGIQSVYLSCGTIGGSTCNGDELDALETALNYMCYDSESYEDKYTCGVAPGSPSTTQSDDYPAATGYSTYTYRDGEAITYELYPSYSSSLYTTEIYKHTILTETYASTTKTITTDLHLYNAVCPTIVVASAVGSTITTKSKSNNVKYSTLSASLGSETGTVSRKLVLLTGSTTMPAVLTRSSASPSVTGTAANVTNSASAAVSAVSKAGSGRLGSASGWLVGSIILGIVAIL